jgi:hypothetical protein
METKKIRPALYKFDELPWSWVKLSELAECVGMGPLECWNDFFRNLGNDELFVLVDDRIRVYVDPYFTEESKYQEGKVSTSDMSYTEAWRAFVPAGAVKRVLGLPRAGLDVIRRSAVQPNKGYAYRFVVVYNLTQLRSWVRIVGNQSVLEIPEITEEDLQAFKDGVRPDGSRASDEGMVQVWEGSSWDRCWVKEFDPNTQVLVKGK